MVLAAGVAGQPHSAESVSQLESIRLMSVVPASTGNGAPDAEEAQHDAGTAEEPPIAQSQAYTVEDDQEDIRDTEQRAKYAPLQPACVETDEATSRHEAALDVRIIYRALHTPNRHCVYE